MTGFEAEYKDAYEAYNRHEISDQDFAKKKQEVVEQYAIEVLDSEPIEAIRRTWFKDYGCMNGWSWKTSLAFAVASMLHDHDMKQNPSFHSISSIDTTQSTCICGMKHSCESGD